jgi:hypothetical protein
MRHPEGAKFGGLGWRGIVALALGEGSEGKRRRGSWIFGNQPGVRRKLIVTDLRSDFDKRMFWVYASESWRERLTFRLRTIIWRSSLDISHNGIIIQSTQMSKY